MSPNAGFTLFPVICPPVHPAHAFGRSASELRARGIPRIWVYNVGRKQCNRRSGGVGSNARRQFGKRGEGIGIRYSYDMGCVRGGPVRGIGIHEERVTQRCRASDKFLKITSNQGYSWHMKKTHTRVNGRFAFHFLSSPIKSPSNGELDWNSPEGMTRACRREECVRNRMSWVARRYHLPYKSYGSRRGLRETFGRCGHQRF
jgi:hypothetical protein